MAFDPTVEPFSATNAAIAKIFSTSPAMGLIGVQPENVLDVTSDDFVQVDPNFTPATGNLPRLIVFPAGGELAIFGGKQADPRAIANSRTTTLTRKYIVGVATDSLRAGGDWTGSTIQNPAATPLTLFTVQWALVLALASQPSNLGLPFVNKYYPPQFADKGLIDEIAWLQKGTNRWTAAIGITVEMYFTTYDLISFVQGLS